MKCGGVEEVEDKMNHNFSLRTRMAGLGVHGFFPDMKTPGQTGSRRDTVGRKKVVGRGFGVVGLA